MLSAPLYMASNRRSGNAGRGARPGESRTKMRRIPPRTIERQACDLGCSIEANEASEELRARVRNLSLTGARLEGPELDGCPDVFELRIVHDSGAVEQLSARCIWRSPGVIGVRFYEANAGLARRPKIFSRVT
jgi:hypothetical protein